jgi:hypothetical protein
VFGATDDIENTIKSDTWCGGKERKREREREKRFITELKS